ncbi:DUF2760 domain-containing protein [Thiocystis violacea]|uniref:DUF2760 domain-containing protein n=1 Tax=Thiocystis violacea TaxID=13725 RepID=UPI0019038C1A|nr:DUF2760 domain-containing protein [Thiocystis violacea]MBK1722360.1 hypothetical protein [Thiocystis violacea]
MSSSAPSFLRRASIAFGSFRRIFKDPELARSIDSLLKAGTAPAAARPAAPAVAPLASASPDAALLLLGLLQKEGRLIDFLQENVKDYSDQEVGAAARVVHQGCQKVLQDYLTIAPVRDEPEGSRVTLQPGFDAASVRPTGNVVGNPPFTGALVHRGWRVVEIRLPKVTSGHDLQILAAAEVEL